MPISSFFEGFEHLKTLDTTDFLLEGQTTVCKRTNPFILKRTNLSILLTNITNSHSSIGLETHNQISKTATKSVIARIHPEADWHDRVGITNSGLTLKQKVRCIKGF